MRAALLGAAIALTVLTGDARGQQPNFSSESQVVVLHVAVRDKKDYVSRLEQSAFHVFENKQPQAISFFSAQDAPVTIGLVIDSSGSMAPNRDRVIAAAIAFAEHSNPQDDLFVLGFNETVKSPLPKDDPFTRDIVSIRTALNDAIAARGQSAVYDAVDAGLAYLEHGQYERKVIVLVSDGGDNASSVTKNQILAKAQASNAVIYTVGIIDPIAAETDPGFLRQLSEATGGQSFQPESVADVGRVLQRVSRDIRNMYTIGYVPSATTRTEELRRVMVEVTLPGGHKATVRTRRAYLAGHADESGTGDANDQ